MPTLKIDTSNSTTAAPGSRDTGSHSRSSTPIPPPISPLTPVLSHATIAPDSAALASRSQRRSESSTMDLQSPKGTRVSPTAPASTSPAANLASQPQPQPQPQYTHSQPPQTFVPPPTIPSEPISFSSNPDAIALQSAISILQMQRMRATQDIETLQAIKERALQDPDEFARAMMAGEIKSTKTSKAGTITNALVGDSESESEVDQEENKDNTSKPAWPTIPVQQSIVRTPQINWSQYAVVGDALDKMHADQVARPTQSVPAVAKVDASGRLVIDEMRTNAAAAANGGGQREAVIAAPYTPGKDRIERPPAKKTGKK